MPYCAKMRIFAVFTIIDKMRFESLIPKALYIGVVVACLALAACHSEPKTPTEHIEAMQKQLQADAKSMDELEAKDFAQLKKDFITCDSMLQFMHPETVDEVFNQLQLTDAYLAQFKETRPILQADMDSTLLRLDQLKSDIETHYLSDSLVVIYLEDETQHVNLINNQVQYFKDRFSTCKEDLQELKKKL